MKTIRNLRQRLQQYWKIFLPILAVLLVVLVVFIFAYRASVNELYMQTMKEVDQTLELRAQALDNELVSLYQTADSFVQGSETLQAFCREAEINQGVLPYYQMKMIQEFKRHFLCYQLDWDIFLLMDFDNRPDVLLSHDHNYLDFGTMYGRDAFPYAVGDYNSFLSSIRNSASSVYLFDGFFAPSAEKDRFFWAHQFAVPGKSCTLYLLVPFTHHQLRVHLLPIQDDTFSLSVCDSMGNLLSGNTAAHNAETILRRTRLKIGVGLDGNYRTEQLSALHTVYRWSFGLLTVVAFFSMVMLVGLVIVPVRRMARRMQPHDSSRDALETIETGLHSLVEHNVAMRKTLQNWRPVLVTNLIERLLEGEELSDEEWELIPHMQPGAEEDVFQVFLLCVPEDGSVAQGLERYAQRLSQLQEKIRFFYPQSVIQPGRLEWIAVICKGAEVAGRSEVMERLAEAFAWGEGTEAIWAIGEPQPGSGGIAASFQQAQRALHYAKRWGIHGCVWYVDIGATSADGAISYLQLDHLHTLLTSGDEAQTCAFFDSLTDILLGCGQSWQGSEGAFYQFFFDVRSQILRVISEQNLSEGMIEKLPAYRPQMTALELCSEYREALIHTSELVRSRIEKRSDSIISAIVEDVNAHYPDCNLNLSQLADKYRMTDKALSSYFKARTGMLFSDYLENLRMQNADHLMKTTDLTLTEISQQCGYAVFNTFSRAYKRKYNLSPSQRRMYLKEDDHERSEG